MLTSFYLQKKSSEVCIKARSTPASLLFKGLVTEHTTVKKLISQLGYSDPDYFVAFSAPLFTFVRLISKFVIGCDSYLFMNTFNI